MAFFPHHTVMRLRTVLPAITLSLSLLLPAASAKTFVPSISVPTTHKDAEKGLLELKKNMEKVVCGGWQEEPLTATKDYFPLVTGAPGRTNEKPLANKKTGMGSRSSFQYPTVGETNNPDDTEDNTGAWGFATACDITDHDLLIKIPDEKYPVDATHPEMRVDINPESLCLKENGVDKRTPEDCKKLYKDLRAMAVDPKYAGMTDTCGIPVRFCFSPESTYECAGDKCETTGVPTFTYLTALCLPIVGMVRLPLIVKRNISSFYRHYAIKAQTASTDLHLRGECYEYYQPENDPKTTITRETNEQCELVMTTATGGVLATPDPEWKPVEKQKGRYLPDPALINPSDDARDTRSAPDPWMTDADTNLSMLDMSKVTQTQADFTDASQKKNITPFLSADLPVKQKASKTLSTARVDAFDDTATGVGGAVSILGIEGSVSRWWEAQQRAFARLVRQPALHLLLPAHFMLGLDKDDPLLQYSADAPSKSDGTVELTLHAGNDELGTLLSSLQKHFPLPVKEVRIPVIAPLLSVVEADSAIASWRLWQQANPARAGDADRIISQIGAYRDAAERVRLLRTALPLSLSRSFALQEKIRRFVSAWELMNAERMRAWLQISTQRQQLQRDWQTIAQAMLAATECQLDWCSNQRYSSPVYSLLDGWLSGWGWKAMPGVGTYQRLRPLPVLPQNVVVEPDRMLDFSWLSLSGSALQIPVLDPILTQVVLPLPPDGIDTPMPDLPELPDTPSNLLDSIPVQDVLFPDGITYDEASKTFTIDDKYLIPHPRAPQLATALVASSDMVAIVAGSGDDSRNSLKGAYCRFGKSLLAPIENRDKKIVHVENDLQERVARLLSRYAPNQIDDFTGRTERIAAYVSDATCAGDGVCTHPVPTTTTRWQWQWLLHAPGKEIQKVYDAVRAAIIPSEDQNPYFQTTTDLMRRLLPPSLQPSAPLSPLKK